VGGFEIVLHALQESDSRHEATGVLADPAAMKEM
jgi:hypothetical protein